MGSTGDSMVRTPRKPGRAGRHPLVLPSDTRVYRDMEKTAHQTSTASGTGDIGPGQYTVPSTMGATTDVRMRRMPRYTVQNKTNQSRRFLSKQHSAASEMGVGSPGPAIYNRHLPLSVGDSEAFEAQHVRPDFASTVRAYPKTMHD